MSETPFWKRKTLAQMSREEWESLCDGCGRCCLVKLLDEDTEELHHTDVACKLLERGSCRCGNYAERTRLVPDCLVLAPATVGSMDFLPPTCAYRLVADGRDLYWWHPLVSGDPETVHQAGISVRGRVVSEESVEDADLEDHIVKWPGRAGSGEGEDD